MNIRNSLLAAALAASALPAAFAEDVPVGEGYNTHPPAAPSGLTREQVRAEARAFRAHPVLADGSVVVGGEVGTVSSVQGAYADREPATPHTHVLGNNAAPNVDLRGDFGGYHGQ